MFGLFGGTRQKSALIIDIGSSSIGGAYVVFPQNGSPLVPYSIRQPISFPGDERNDLCMLRALEPVLTTLYTEGRAAFHRATKQHHVDRIFISLDAPWQETRVETQIVGDGKPFVFTRDILASAVKKRTALPEGKKELQNEVVATLLNGYQTTEPFGKRAERAEIIFLSSSMDAETMNLISRAVKRFGARQGVLISPVQSLAHAVLRAQYPHDRDFLLMLVTNETTDVLFANRGIIMDATSVPIGLSELVPRDGMRTLPVNGSLVSQEITPAVSSKEIAWTTGVSSVLKEFASRHALPRIVFLVAHDGSALSLKRFLDTSDMHTLWLSDESLTVIPVVSKLLSSLIRHQGTADADVMLDLVALFAQLKLK